VRFQLKGGSEMLDLAPYILSSAAGLVLVIGCLFLLWKGRIVLDTEGKSVSQIELPGGVRFATQFPVLILFALGVVLLIFPLYQARNICADPTLHKKNFPEMVRITGKIVSARPIDVFAIVDEQSDTHDAVLLTVPFRKDARYRVLYSLNNQVLENSSISLTNTDPYKLDEFEYQTTPEAAGPQPTPLAGPANTVPPDVEAQFKKGGNQ
jgi:hypothetical protein